MDGITSYLAMYFKAHNKFHDTDKVALVHLNE